MAKTIYKLTFGIVGIFVVLHPVLVHSDPLFFKNSGTAGGKRPKFFWDIFGVFGSKEEISPSSSYGPPSSYKNPTYIVQQPSTYNPPKPFYGPPSSAKPSGTIVTNKPSYKPQSFPSSYLPPKPSYTIPSSTGQKRPSYNPSSSQGSISFPSSATNSRPTFTTFNQGRPNFPPATNPPIWPSKPGNQDLPNYSPPYGPQPDQFGLVVTQQPIYKPCECSQQSGTASPIYPFRTTVQFPTSTTQNQPDYRPQSPEVIEIPTTVTTATTTSTSVSTTILTTQPVEILEARTNSSTLDPFQAEILPNVTSSSEELGRLEEAKAEPQSTLGDGWVPMTLQKVMDIVTGGDYNNIQPKRQFQLQRKPKITNPDLRKGIRQNQSVRLKDRVTGSKLEFREPRTGARHMNHDSPKMRLKHVDFKVSDPEITTTATTTTTTSTKTTKDSNATDASVEQDDKNETVFLVFPENHVMSEALDKRRLKSENFFDHSLNTLATLAHTNIDLLSTTERSGNEEDDYNEEDDDDDLNEIGFVSNNDTKWAWKLQEVSPDNFDEESLSESSSVTLPPGDPDSESDFILLSDAWFKNYTSLPSISLSAFNLTDDGLVFDPEMIDLTSNGNSNDDDQLDRLEDLEDIEKIKNDNVERKPKNLDDGGLVKFYPIHGKPFLSFQPEVQISNIVKYDSII